MADNENKNGDNNGNGTPIVVKDLAKSFGSQKVLNGIGFQVARAETLAVLGRSGTGKSVLLKLMIGLQKPDSGSLLIHGQDIPTLPLEQLDELRKKMGFLFQQGALYDSLTVEENVTFPLTRHTKLSESEGRKRARELLQSVGMEHDGQKMPSEISGGMQKRVGLARALALDPDILLSDEPTSGLDPITAAEIGGLIVDLKKQRQMTSVVVTHDIHQAKVFADRLVLIDQGRVVMEGTFDDLQKSEDEFVRRFLKDAGQRTPGRSQKETRKETQGAAGPESNGANGHPASVR
jgi:phospholipid/cholesterol/gamma-HCH transport system ATP-binding protein